jgi:serine-type D-Ala-D-Ala carboxypeptidase/endopeptidase (penicillin-binding protein 4)
LAVFFTLDDTLALIIHPKLLLEGNQTILKTQYLQERNWLYPFMIMGCIVLASCSTGKNLTKSKVKPLLRLWNELNLSSGYHVGLSIYDLNKDKSIFSYKADNFFTPASNIKIHTMYASLKILDEHLEAARYFIKGDSMILWGAADPGTLYPDIHSTSPIIDFIRLSDKKVYFSNSHFRTERFGAGWAWDDYPYTFQCERNAFPVYGNRIWIENTDGTIKVTPSYLLPLVSIKKDSVFSAGKSEWGDDYIYTYTPQTKDDTVTIPITFFKKDIQYCWSEATGKDIALLDVDMPSFVLPVRGSVRDTLIKLMMQESDNFIAEQLLLACSMKALNFISEEAVIDNLTNSHLKEIAGEMEWWDGSGLSRYNRATPQSLVWLIKNMIRDKGMKYMTSIFPAAGQNGTMKDWNDGNPAFKYLYAKTGTLRQVYCLSGFLTTRSGKVLVFSWMNNQFPGEKDEIISAMEQIFSFLYDHY